jgi:hypothetical protein
MELSPESSADNLEGYMPGRYKAIPNRLEQLKMIVSQIARTLICCQLCSETMLVWKSRLYLFVETE